MDNETRRETAREAEAEIRRTPATLRGYQLECLEAIADGHTRSDSVCVELPTGTGKTVIFTRYAAQQDYGRALVICPQLTLIRQAAAKIMEETGEAPAIEQAGLWSAEGSPDMRSRFVVASKQTLCKRRKSGKFRYERFGGVGLVVIDECHYAGTSAYRKMCSWFRHRGAKILGVSATLRRHDGVPMRKVFEECVFQYGVREAVDDGWLVKPRVKVKQIKSLDLTDVATGATFTGRDYNAKQLDAKLTNPAVVFEIADAIQQHTRERRTAVFCASVNEAQAVAEVLQDNHGISAAWICSDEKRVPPAQWRAIMDKFTAGEITHIANVGQLTTGWDLPELDAIVMARPTQSVGLYTQMLGRGTRPLPGVVDFAGSTPDTRRERIAASAKPWFVVIDLVDNSLSHKIVTAGDVLSGHASEDDRERLRQRAAESAEPIDLDAEALADAWAQEVQAFEVERARRKNMLARAEWSDLEVDAFTGQRVQNRNTQQAEPATYKQLRYLRWKLGKGLGKYRDLDHLTKAQASRMIGKIIQEQGD